MGRRDSAAYLPTLHELLVKAFLRSIFLVVVVVGVEFRIAGEELHAQEVPGKLPSSNTEEARLQKEFSAHVQPLLRKYCLDCHNADNMESGVRVDHLTGGAEEAHLKLWSAILKQLDGEKMPPQDAMQPSAAERKGLTEWIQQSLTSARSRPTPRNGSVRRLTVAQYRNTLRDLLGLQEDLTDSLPPDGISKDGFTNQEQSLTLSPLQVEAYFDIAEQALTASIVDESKRPVIQNFRMEFGAKINPAPCPDKLILGANSELLGNADFVVTEPLPSKPFEFEPFRMRTAYDFIEGYAGNDTVRGWRKYDSIYHSVFACVRGTPGYPKGEAQQVIPAGLLLRPAIPSPEIFGVSNTYGPMANFKISLRELPAEGDFRVTVKAARYDDALLLDTDEPAPSTSESQTTVDLATASSTKLQIDRAGIFQVDVRCTPADTQNLFTLTLGDRQFAAHLKARKPAESDGEQLLAFAVVRIAAGEHQLAARYGDDRPLNRIMFSRLTDENPLGQRFQKFEQRSALLGVHLGLRRDCGSTLTQVGPTQTVSTSDLKEYVFEGAIRDFPSPDVEPNNVNYLAGIREIGVHSEFTDGRDMPRLLIHSVNFEGPYYPSWPPPSHRRIFIDSPHRNEPATYAREILSSFATRAFRRPVRSDEEKALLAVWQKSIDEKKGFQQSIKDALLVVLTSPQFLFLIENSSGPHAEELDPYELAFKLSYFLWNTAPDQPLLDLAGRNELHKSIDAEIDRLISDPRFGQFAQEFASQWLTLDKLDVVSTDASRFPNLTRDAKKQLRQEPIQLLQYLIEHNLPLRNLVQSEFIVANEVVANYYGLADRTESGLEFVAIEHHKEHLGGILTQAGILAGLSDGRESNPVKRGAWFARKIIAEPPDDPPPNVPQLKDDDTTKLTIRQKLERHRDQKGCAKCHSGIDPWGIPFESFDAGGLLKLDSSVDARSTLPDGTAVAGLNGLKEYLAAKRMEQVAYSFLKHLANYATGRHLTHNELALLRQQALNLQATEYRMKDVLKLAIHSESFLKK